MVSRLDLSHEIPRRRGAAVAVLLLLLGCAWTLGCGDRDSASPRLAGTAAESPESTRAVALAAQWTALEARYRTLRELRGRLAGQGGRKDASALRLQADALAAEYSRGLTLFLNRTRHVEGAELALRREAIRRKSTEDSEVARRFIEEAGDYRRAIEIYEAALSIDPVNPELRRALAEAQAEQFTSAAKLAEVKEGMSPDEVRALLGPPNLHNVREYPGGIVAWFYDREEGGAAGIWFEKKGAKGLAVYASAFDAVPAGGPLPPAPGRPAA
jgi:tetratricopeptide (TPR) repeat protein